MSAERLSLNSNILGKGSPVVVTVLPGHSSLLVLPPVPLVVGNIPTVLVDVPPDLRLDLLRLEQPGQQTRPGGSATLRFLVGKSQEVCGQGNSDLHGGMVSQAEYRGISLLPTGSAPGS